MIEIPLTKDKFALIDDDDFEKVNQYKWHCNAYGYAVRFTARPNRKVMWLHRFIMKCPKNKEVDHINSNTLDNRKINLRICTKKQNTKNKSISSNNTTGYKGVSIDKRTRRIKRFRSYIVIDNKQKSLGIYLTAKEAAIAYNKAAIKYFGEYAKVNII